VFCFGDILYNPGNHAIPEHLLVHEGVHEAQQTGFFMNPKKWWRRYIDDPQFRLYQEVDAYNTQLKFIATEVRDKNTLLKFKTLVAKELSGEMYGNMVDYSEALDLLYKQ
jgi:hypothetical protein